MRLDAYVNYRGTCEQAFHFYEEHLGGKITGIVRHGEMAGNPNIPDNWKDKVLHAQMEIASTVLMGADIPHAEPTRSAYLTLTLDWEEDAERIFSTFANDGEILMKMEKTHFANRFGMVRDKFGIAWMFLQGVRE